MDFPWLELFLAAPILGHVLYGIPTASAQSGKLRVSLHNGDDFSSRDEAPHPDRLESVRCVTEDKVISLTATGSKADGVEVEVPPFLGGPSVLVVETPPTRIDLEASKFENYLKHEGLDEVIIERHRRGESQQAGHEIYSKHIKVILPDRDAQLLSKPVGLPIELVPISSLPHLRVQLLVAGQPRANAQIRVSYRLSDEASPVPDLLQSTNELGEVLVRIDKAGLWRLHAISMQRLEDHAEADWCSIWTSLTLRVEK